MFIITWMFDKLGYMPKIDMQVGKINLDVKSPEFKMWPFPETSDDFEPRPKAKPKAKKKPATKKVIVPKATTRKPKTK
jgi:hypothetical protein